MRFPFESMRSPFGTVPAVTAEVQPSISVLGLRNVASTCNHYYGIVPAKMTTRGQMAKSGQTVLSYQTGGVRLTGTKRKAGSIDEDGESVMGGTRLPALRALIRFTAALCCHDRRCQALPRPLAYSLPLCPPSLT
jgi:hypothetical protein